MPTRHESQVIEQSRKTKRFAVALKNAFICIYMKITRQAASDCPAVTQGDIGDAATRSPTLTSKGKSMLRNTVMTSALIVSMAVAASFTASASWASSEAPISGTLIKGSAPGVLVASSNTPWLDTSNSTSCNATTTIGGSIGRTAKQAERCPRKPLVRLAGEVQDQTQDLRSEDRILSGKERQILSLQVTASLSVSPQKDRQTAVFFYVLGLSPLQKPAKKH